MAGRMVGRRGDVGWRRCGEKKIAAFRAVANEDGGGGEIVGRCALRVGGQRRLAWRTVMPMTSSPAWQL